LVEYENAELRQPFIDGESRLGRSFNLTGKVCLDAGCGSGLKTIHMALSGAAQVIGVDGSTVGIERARAIAHYYDLNNITFVCALLENLDQVLKGLTLDKVDYIHNIANIHHVSDWRGMIGIFHRIAKPGAYIRIAWVEPSMSWASFNIKN
jgi:2-polyprenyl-3-methyl-5-hydroxy-6-metoxy-1,4-benzoquinol methylase